MSAVNTNVNYADRLLDGPGLGGPAQRVLQQHGHRQDGGHGIDDALAGDIRRGS